MYLSACLRTTLFNFTLNYKQYAEGQKYCQVLRFIGSAKER
jgi:hypothetical protein